MTMCENACANSAKKSAIALIGTDSSDTLSVVGARAATPDFLPSTRGATGRCLDAQHALRCARADDRPGAAAGGDPGNRLRERDVHHDVIIAVTTCAGIGGAADSLQLFVGWSRDDLDVIVDVRDSRCRPG